MQMNDYQIEAASTAVYPDAGTGSVIARAYVGLKLAGEAGEVAEKFGKVMRDEPSMTIDDASRIHIAKELGDTLWYIARAASEISMTLEQVAEMNLAKLSDRATRGVLQGSGDDR